MDIRALTWHPISFWLNMVGKKDYFVKKRRTTNVYNILVFMFYGNARKYKSCL